MAGKTQRRKRNAPLVKLTMEARGMTRKQLYMGRVGYGLNGMFKGNTMKRGYSGGNPTLNNSLTNENVANIEQINTSLLLNNVRRHGQGNNYNSPYLRNRRLNDLPTRQSTPTRKAPIHKTPSTPRKMTTLRRRGRHTNRPSPSTPKRKPNTNNTIAPPAPKKSKKV